jgi:hypothetical protein
MNITENIIKELENIKYINNPIPLTFIELNILLDDSENFIKLSINGYSSLIERLNSFLHIKDAVTFTKKIMKQPFFIDNKIDILSNIDYFLYSLNFYDDSNYIQNNADFCLFELLYPHTTNKEDFDKIFPKDISRSILSESIKTINKKEPEKTLLLLECQHFKKIAKYMDINFFNDLLDNNKIYKINKNLKNF